MNETRLVIDVLNVPEALADMQHRLADMLREVAESESDPRISRRLIEIAADFEVGL